jgi:hypothetical protein
VAIQLALRDSASQRALAAEVFERQVSARAQTNLPTATGKGANFRQAVGDQNSCCRPG